MLPVKNIKMIDLYDLNELVEKTYNRPYNFQQQDGCKDRGVVYVTVPSEEANDYGREIVTEEVNADGYNDRGVSFKAWLERDPSQLLPLDEEEFKHGTWSEDVINHVRTHGLGLWWDRNFYPHIDMVLDDLHKKGLIEAGEYGIDIDW